MKYGRCKECENNRIPLDKTTQIVGDLEKDFELMGATFKADKGKVYDIWECPTCGYPHNIDDFMGVYEE